MGCKSVFYAPVVRPVVRAIGGTRIVTSGQRIYFRHIAGLRTVAMKRPVRDSNH